MPYDFSRDFEILSMGFRSNRDNAGMPVPGLLERQFEVASGGQGDDLKAVRKRFDHTERAAADASGRSQNRDALHG